MTREPTGSDRKPPVQPPTIVPALASGSNRTTFAERPRSRQATSSATMSKTLDESISDATQVATRRRAACCCASRRRSAAAWFRSVTSCPIPVAPVTWPSASRSRVVLHEISRISPDRVRSGASSWSATLPAASCSTIVLWGLNVSAQTRPRSSCRAHPVSSHMYRLQNLIRPSRPVLTATSCTPSRTSSRRRSEALASGFCARGSA